MEGNALVTTKIARVDNEAIIPARTCNEMISQIFKTIPIKTLTRIYSQSPCSQVEGAHQEKPTEEDQPPLLEIRYDCPPYQRE